MRFLLLILMISGFQSSASAQSFSGKIIYKISFADSLGAAIEGMDSQKSAEYVTDSVLRVDQNSRLGTQTTLINFKDSTYHILMDVQDIKIAISMPPDVLYTTDSLKPSIKYKCKSKKIAGIKCKLALVTYPDNETIPVYYAKTISGKLNQKFAGLKGYPMEYTLKHDGLTEHYQALEIDESVVSKEHLSIPSDYRIMTVEEFMKAMGE